MQRELRPLQGLPLKTVEKGAAFSDGRIAARCGARRRKGRAAARLRAEKSFRPGTRPGRKRIPLYSRLRARTL